MQLVSRYLVTLNRTRFAATLVVLAMLYGGPAYAIQDGLPPIRPADSPEAANPFQDYEQEDAANPFQDYEQADTTPQQTPDQKIDRNDLRGTATPVAPKQIPDASRQPLMPSRATQPAQAQPLTDRPNRTPAFTPRRPGNQQVIVDPNLQPTTYNAPTTSNSRIPSTSNVQLAKNLLSELSVEGNMTRSEGQAMGLQDLLVNSSPGKRKSLVYQYWRTWGAWAEYRFGQDQLHWLQQIRQPRTQSDRATLEAALSTAQDDVSALKLELTHQQNLLDEYITGPQSETMPLPSDSPLVGRYRTHYEHFASQRTMPKKMRAIHSWLPSKQQLIVDRATTVQRWRNAVMQATQDISQGQPVAAILQSMEMSSESHTEFITTVVRYNQRIAEYALTVKPNNAAAEQVVAMLIPVKPVATDNPYSNQTRQATLPQNSYGRTNGNPSTIRNNVAPLRSNTPQRTESNPFQGGTMIGDQPTRQPAANQQPSINPGGFDARGNLQQPATRPGTAGGVFRR